jgi:arylsulfatase A-like enzyme
VPKDRDQPIPDDLARNLVHGYFACVSYVDTQVGRVFETLDRTGLAENTIVVIWGDHGWKLGEHGMWGKHTPFELDARVPMMIRAPVGTPGFRVGYATGLVETVDLYPTLCDLAGLPTPDHVQGRSLRPMLEDPSHPGKPAAFTEWPRNDRTEPEKVITALSVRTDRYRYIEWTRRATGEVLATELYDHEVDPDENHNIAGDPANARTVAELSGLLDQGKGWRRLPQW